MGTLCSTARRAARLFPTQCVRAPIPACPPTPAVFWVFVLTTAGPAGLLKARFQAARPRGPAVSRPPSQGRGRASESLEKRMALPTVGSVCVSVGAEGGSGFPSRCPANASPTKLRSRLGGKQKAPEQPALCCGLCPPGSMCHTHKPLPGLVCHTQHPCQLHSRTPATQRKHGPAASSAQALPGSTPVRAGGSCVAREMGLQRFRHLGPCWALCHDLDHDHLHGASLL